MASIETKVGKSKYELATHIQIFIDKQVMKNVQFR